MSGRAWQQIARIGQGIEEHGQAFAAWAEYVGPDQAEQLDRFEDYYLGEWENLQAYAEYRLEEGGAYRALE